MKGDKISYTIESFSAFVRWDKLHFLEVFKLVLYQNITTSYKKTKARRLVVFESMVRMRPIMLEEWKSFVLVTNVVTLLAGPIKKLKLFGFKCRLSPLYKCRKQRRMLVNRFNEK